MRIVFLVQGKDSIGRFRSFERPEGVDIELDAGYGEDGDNLFIVGYAAAGTSLEAARKMADLRDRLLEGNSAQILVDEPSGRFCEDLYKRFDRFERTLRCVLRLALCSEKGRFKDELIADLEFHSLEKIHSGWLCSDEFQRSVRSLTAQGKGSTGFSKEQLVRLVDEAENETVWGSFFPPDAMPTVRERFKDIQGYRNDVMHFHRVTHTRYREALNLVEKANRELDGYARKFMGQDAESFAPVDPGFPAVEALKGVYALQRALIPSDVTSRMMEQLTGILQSELMPRIDAVVAARCTKLADASGIFQSVTRDNAHGGEALTEKATGEEDEAKGDLAGEGGSDGL